MAVTQSSAATTSKWVSFARHHAALVGGAVVAAPLIVASVKMLTVSGYAPYADLPLIELSIRDVGHHPVLLGAYSRFGWYHPGPLAFYVLAVPYRLLGSQAVSLPAAAGLLNAGWVFVAAWLARRRAGVAGLALVLAGLAIVLRTIGTGMWTDAWNPSVAVLPFAVFMLACWGISAADDLCLIVAVVAGSFCLQSHAGYLPLLGLVAALGIGSRVAVAVAQRRRPEHSEGSEATVSTSPPPPPGGGRTIGLHTAVIVAVVVGIVLWLPPLVDQVLHDPGNMRQIAGYSRDVKPVNTLTDGVRLISYELAVPPAWVTGELEPGWLGLLDVRNSPVPIGGALLVAAGAVAVWRREVDALRLVLLTAGAVIAAIVAVSRFADGIYPYMTQWSPIIGMFVWLAIIWVGWRAALPRLAQGARRTAGGLVGAFVLTVSLVNIASGVGAVPHDLDRAAPILALTDAAEPHLERNQPVVVAMANPSGGVEAIWTSRGVALELDRRGFDVRGPDGDALPSWRADQSPATQVVAIRRMVDDVPHDWEGKAPIVDTGGYAVWVAPVNR